MYHVKSQEHLNSSRESVYILTQIL